MKIFLAAIPILIAFNCFLQAKDGSGIDRQTARPVTMADPYIYYENGTYYLYGTSSDNGIAVLISKDLKTWEYPNGDAQHLALNKCNCYGDKWFWAPEVYKINGRYVMFHSAEEHICMAEADSPLGPFKCTTDAAAFDVARGTATSSNTSKAAESKLAEGKETESKAGGYPMTEDNGIDNSLFIDDDGTPYMFWVRFDHGNVIWMAQLTPDLKHPIKGTERCIIRPELPWEKSVTEGPFCIKHNGIYYLTYSGDGYQSQDYAIGYATATSLDGEWTKFAGNPILRRPEGLFGTGHHSFFKDKKGKNRIVFHAHYSDTKVHPRRTLISTYSFKKTGAGPDELVISQDYAQPYIK